MSKKTLEKMEKIAEILGTDKVSIQDFERYFNVLIKAVKQINERQAKALKDLENKKYNDIVKAVKISYDAEVSKLLKGLDSEIKDRTNKINTLEKNTFKILGSLKNGEQGPQGEKGEDGSPDSAEDVRNKLELLEGDERLDAQHVKNIEKIVDKMLSKRTFGGGGSSVDGAGAVKAYDLSASLDGVTKTFSIPAFWRVISVQLSSFPNVMRENVDYTTNGSAFTITFTDQIDAGSSLATGQSLIILYASL